MENLKKKIEIINKLDIPGDIKKEVLQNINKIDLKSLVLVLQKYSNTLVESTIKNIRAIEAVPKISKSEWI